MESFERQALCVLYDAVEAAQAKYEHKSDELRTAKKALEAATSALLEHVRAVTQEPALPLEDAS
jgi:hypothetical protein